MTCNIGAMQALMYPLLHIISLLIICLPFISLLYPYPSIHDFNPKHPFSIYVPLHCSSPSHQLLMNKDRETIVELQGSVSNFWDMKIQNRDCIGELT